jgi:hypothetical protein
LYNHLQLEGYDSIREEVIDWLTVKGFRWEGRPGTIGVYVLDNKGL